MSFNSIAIKFLTQAFSSNPAILGDSDDNWFHYISGINQDLIIMLGNVFAMTVKWTFKWQ